MKKMRMLSLFLSLLMLFSIMAPSVNASALSLVEDDDEITEMQVYVDAVRIKSVNVYMDSDGELWVEDYTSLKKIFPEETKDLLFPSKDEDTPLQHWADQFGYFLSAKNGKAYLTKSSSASKDDPKIPILEEDDPKIPVLDDEDDFDSSDLVIYKNSLKMSMKEITLFLDNKNRPQIRKGDLKKVFPTEAKKVTGTSKVLLEDWAKKYGYAFVQKGNKIYLNNDKHVPVQVLLNGKLVDFPDQQPIIVSPGRTMIPVAILSRELGFNAEWVSKKNTNAKYDRVVIKNPEHSMILWIGYDSYWLDGCYYKMDVKPYVTNGRTMLPLVYISQAFGLNITFDGASSVKVVGLYQ